MDTERLIKTLRRDEGVRSTAYLDTEGIPTVGVGRNLRDNGYGGEKYDTVEAFVADYPDGLTDEQIDAALLEDLPPIITKLEQTAQERGFDFHSNLSLSDVRREVMINVAFNVGANGYSRWTSHWGAIAAGDWVEAAYQLHEGKAGKTSKYSDTVGMRAIRLSHALLSDDPAAFRLRD